MHEKLFSNRPPIVILILLTVFIAIYVVDVFIISFMSFAVTTIWESLISVSAFNPWLFTAAVFNDDSHTLIIIPSLISHAFIHKNLWHLILNCGFFIIFGAPVATRIGWWRFLLVFLGGAIFGALTYWANEPDTMVAMIGASGGIAALLGAVTRFMDNSKPGLEPANPRLSLGESVSGRYSGTLIAFFLVSNIIIPILEMFNINTAIAWQAHIGGFIFGWLFFAIFDTAKTKVHNDHTLSL